MHRVFQMDEFMTKVLTEVRSSDVATMARVCQSFNGLASDILWKEISSITPLLMCMPSDLVRVAKNGKTMYLKFTRDPVPEDWKRFNFYAARVRCYRREIFFRYRSPVKLGGSIPLAFEFLIADSSSSNLNLFPRLQYLEVSHDMDENEFQLLYLMIGPQLRSFRLGTGIYDTHFVPTNSINFLLKRLGSCRSLTHLIIKDINKDQPSLANNIVTHMPSLQAFHCYPVVISSEVLVSLADHTSLKELSFTLEESTFFGFTAQLLPKSRPFSALETVRVSTRDLNVFTTFIKTFHLCQLQTISCGLRTTPTLAAVDNYISTLHSFFSHAKLERLELELETRASESSYDAPTIDSRTLRPLFVFRNLRTVKIKIHVTYNLDNSFISDVASSWPLLSELILKGDWQTPRKISLEGLLPLARKCPNLSTLSLVIDGKVLPTRTSSRPDNNSSSSTLRLLELGDSEVDDVNEGEVAAYLADIFPCATTNYEDRGKSWARISMLIPVFSRVRKEERHRTRVNKSIMDVPT